MSERLLDIPRWKCKATVTLELEFEAGGKSLDHVLAQIEAMRRDREGVADRVVECGRVCYETVAVELGEQVN